MKKIIEIKKKNNDQYLLTLSDESIVIEQETFFKYKNILNNNLSQSDYNELIDFNQYQYLYKLGLKKLKKLMTKKEMIDFLTLKGGKESIVKQIVFKYLEKKYIDDLYYAKTYIHLKSKSEGPQVIKNKLMNKGISLDIINQYLFDIDQDDIIKNLIQKKLKTLKNKSKRDSYQIIKRSLMQKGFELDSIENLLDHELNPYQFNDLEVLKKEFDKLLIKYKNKYDEKTIKQKLTEKLYQKGFLIEDIKKMFSKGDL
jgi:regulatory protein